MHYHGGEDTYWIFLFTEKPLMHSFIKFMSKGKYNWHYIPYWSKLEILGYDIEGTKIGNIFNITNEKMITESLNKNIV